MLFKTVCWPAGRLSSPAHVDNHESRNGAPRPGLGGPSARASPGDAFFARVVPHLAPETLHQLIRYRGLEACGELVTSATPAQLTSLLDLDLWRHAQPGRDEQFDVDRFGEWLEVLVDTGESVAARTVAALDPHLVVTGLSRYVRVFDPGIFEPTASSDDEPMDRHELMQQRRRVGDVLECEVGGYLCARGEPTRGTRSSRCSSRSRPSTASSFHAVMQGCRRLSNSRPEVDGLDDLLMAPEQHLHDVAIERERRRSQHGYATPADARAFLQMARRPRRHRERRRPAAITVNPIVTAYFRAADDDADVTRGGRPPDRRRESPAAGRAMAATTSPTSIDAVIDLLTEAGVMPERPRALLEAADEAPRPAAAPDAEAADGSSCAPRRGCVPHAQSRARVPRQHAARGMLRPVAAVHATGSVRCGGGHLQPGSRVLAARWPA